MEKGAIAILMDYFKINRETPKYAMVSKIWIEIFTKSKRKRSIKWIFFLAAYIQKNELMTLAMQQNTCTKNAIDLKHMVVVAFQIHEKDVHEQTDLMSKLTKCSEYQLNLIEADLNRHHASQNVQHAMKILRLMKLWNDNPFETTIEINTVRVSCGTSLFFHTVTWS